MTDLSTMERALGIIAISVALQTVLMLAGAVAAYVAYRRATAAIDLQLAELRTTTAELAGTVNRAAESVARGTQVVTSAIDDARQSAGAVGAWLGTAASIVTTPRTAAAVGLLRSVQWWKSRRRAAKLAPVTRPY
jgi:hypothetical protein